MNRCKLFISAYNKKINKITSRNRWTLLIILRFQLRPEFNEIDARSTVTPRNFPQDLPLESSLSLSPRRENVNALQIFLFRTNSKQPKNFPFFSNNFALAGIRQIFFFLIISFLFSKRRNFSTSYGERHRCKWQHGRWFTSCLFRGREERKIEKKFLSSCNVCVGKNDPKVARLALEKSSVAGQEKGGRGWGGFALSPNPLTRGGVRARSGFAPKPSWKKEGEEGVGGGGGEEGRVAANFLPPL